MGSKPCPFGCAWDETIDLDEFEDHHTRETGQNKVKYKTIEICFEIGVG